jgi:TPP-dependent pyruvate/acetoin dehydrogenase alpha subunit
VAFFGEGAVAQGMFHEAANLAAIWDLPVLLLCENNRYAEFTDSRTMARVPGVAERARMYGIESSEVDGNDVEAVRDAAADAVARCRGRRGPVLLEALTYRWHGHYEGDAQPYKPPDEVAEWRERDPLVLARRRIAGSASAPELELEAIDHAAAERVEAAIERARDAPLPDDKSAYEHVYVT